METEDNVITREELLAKGCTEVLSRNGRVAFMLFGDFVAVECVKCEKYKKKNSFTIRETHFGGVQPRCKECLAQKQRISRKEKPDMYIEIRKRGREKSLEYSREKYKNNREQEIERVKRWRDDNVDKVKQWRAENRDCFRLITQRRRAREKALPDDITTEQWYNVCAYFGNTCAISGDTDNIHADHVIPLASGWGGSTIGNMIPLRCDLNISKSATNIFEWFEINQERFNLSRVKFDSLIQYLAEANEMSPKEYRTYVDWCFDNPRTIEDLTTPPTEINS